MVNRIILLVLIGISIISKNRNLAAASLIVLALSILQIDRLNAFAGKEFLNIGMVFLMVWMMIPILEEKDIQRNFMTIRGLISFGAGILVAFLASKGTLYLKGNVDVMAGVILGSIVGVSFLGGVPVGPLIASGIAYEIISLFGMLKK